MLRAGLNQNASTCIQTGYVVVINRDWIWTLNKWLVSKSQVKQVDFAIAHIAIWIKDKNKIGNQINLEYYIFECIEPSSKIGFNNIHSTTNTIIKRKQAYKHIYSHASANTQLYYASASKMTLLNILNIHGKPAM